MLRTLNRFGSQGIKYCNSIKITNNRLPSPNLEKCFSTKTELRKQLTLKEKTLRVLAERIKYSPTNEVGKNEWTNAKTLHDQLKASIAELRSKIKESTYKAGVNPAEKIEYKENKEIKVKLIELIKEYKRYFSGSVIHFGVDPRFEETNCFIKDFKHLHDLLDKMTPGIEKDECLRDILHVILKHDTFLLRQIVKYPWNSKVNISVNKGLMEFTLFALKSIGSEDILIETIENIANATTTSGSFSIELMEKHNISNFYDNRYAQDPDLLERAIDKLISGDYDGQPMSEFSKDLCKAMWQAKGEPGYLFPTEYRKSPSLSSLKRAEYLIRFISREDREIAKQKILDQLLKGRYLTENVTNFAVKIIQSIDSEETKDMYLKQFINNCIVENGKFSCYTKISNLILCTSPSLKKEMAKHFLTSYVGLDEKTRSYEPFKEDIKNLLKGLSEAEKQEVIQSLSWKTWAQFKFLNL